MTHGGLLSITNAVYCSIPIIGISAFPVQVYNVANAIKKGFGVTSCNQENFRKLKVSLPDNIFVNRI